ncbi:ABC transporter substrate-binding protein [Deinococcus aluminii]|uniref:HTH-type transcriptional regulator SgrR n=1 Tax=Deinococcus aluminii TaxID=1656885 RepID=A0ABP9XDU1_9DEIO
MTPFPRDPRPDWPYLTLRAALLARDGEQRVYPVTLAELTAWWACSDKTAKRQVSRLQEERKLTYTPGRGRGHTSRVAFSGDVRRELDALTASLARAGAAGDLARLSRLPFPRAWVMTDVVRSVFGLSESPSGTDRLRTVMFRAFTSLDPITAHAATEAHLLAQVLDPLTRFDADTGRLEPHLAHHWNVSADGLMWTFHLRKGVAFHHGRTLDAGDVLFTLERLRQGAGWLLPGVQVVTSNHPFRVQVHLARPDAFLPRRLADSHALILPRDVPFDERHLVGTGAFRWTSLPDGVRLTAFDAHFAGRPLIDEVELYRVGPLANEPTLHVDGAAPETVMNWQEEIGVHFLIWNAGQSAAQNAALRAAVFELHDIRRYWQEAGLPWPLLTAQSFYPRRSKVRPPRHHALERVRSLLTQAGYDGPPLRLWVLNRTDAVQEATWLVQQAARVGLPIEPRTYELHEALDKSSPADLVMMGEVSGPDEHLSFWTAMRQPELLFRTLLPEPLLAEIDAELDSYRTAATFAEREAIIDRVEDLLLRGHHIHLTHHRVKQRTIHPLIRDVLPDSYGRINFRKLWIGDGLPLRPGQA